MATFSQQLQESRRRQAMGVRVAPAASEQQSGAAGAGGGGSGGGTGSFRSGTLTGRGGPQLQEATGRSPLSAGNQGMNAVAPGGAPGTYGGEDITAAYKAKYAEMLAQHQERMAKLNAERGKFSPEAVAAKYLEMARRVKEANDRGFAGDMGARYEAVAWQERNRDGSWRNVTLQPGSDAWYQYLIQQRNAGDGHRGGPEIGNNDGMSGPGAGYSGDAFGNGGYEAHSDRGYGDW